MAHGGRAVARNEGQVVFIDGAFPGEVVEAEVTKRADRHLMATVTKVLEPSPDRVDPPCPHFGPCGGCQWQSTAYPAQLRWKQEIVADQLKFVGRLPEVDVHPTIAVGPEYGYRNRMDFKIIDGRPALNRAESHDLVPLEICLLLAPPLRQVFDKLARPLKGERVTLRAGIKTGETLALFDQERGRLHEEVARVDFQITSRAFFQTNTPGAEKLVELVTEILNPGRDDVMLDGYSGGGLFSATVGRGVKQVWAVESDQVALGDLSVNARTKAVPKAFERAQSQLPRFWDVAVVDPPRDGMGRGGVSTVIAGRPRAIAYVSCDPATFARDAKLLTEAGYHLNWVQPVDLFPQTFHIELVGAFIRV